MAPGDEDIGSVEEGSGKRSKAEKEYMFVVVGDEGNGGGFWDKGRGGKINVGMM